MHNIDLLKGQGIPAKATTGGIMVLTVMVVVPILVAAGMLDWYLQTRIDIGMMEQKIVTAKETISEHAQDVKMKHSLEQDIKLINNKLSEVSRTLKIFVQWTPVLVTLAENMPGPMIMKDLTAQSQSARRTTRRNTDPNKPVSIPIPERSLVMNINGSKPGSYDQTVQRYQESLNKSPVLKPRIKEIIPSKEAGTGSDQSESYIMNIILASDSR
jgi:hypothetical protein